MRLGSLSYLSCAAYRNLLACKVEWLFTRSLVRHRQAKDPSLWCPVPRVKVLQVEKIENRTAAEDNHLECTASRCFKSVHLFCNFIVAYIKPWQLLLCPNSREDLFETVCSAA